MRRFLREQAANSELAETINGGCSVRECPKPRRLAELTHCIDRGSQITTVVSFKISVVRPKPAELPDGAKSASLRPAPLPDDGARH